MSKPIPPNPLPCGCCAKGVQDLENAVETGSSLIVHYRDIHVVHCSLHAAAAAMQSTLIDVKLWCELNRREDSVIYARVCAALKGAK